MRRLALALGCAVLVADCGGGGEKLIPAKKLPSLVLQPSDLPPAFVRFDHGRLEFTDVRAGPRRDERRFGRHGGWKARYRRAGSPATMGPLVVVSTADVFRTVAGARRDLAAYDREFAMRVADSDGAASRLRVQPIGDDARGVTLVQRSGRGVRFYALAWRHANVTAGVVVEGFEDRVSLEDAREAARRQQGRIERAR